MTVLNGVKQLKSKSVDSDGICLRQLNLVSCFDVISTIIIPDVFVIFVGPAFFFMQNCHFYFETRKRPTELQFL